MNRPTGVEIATEIGMLRTTWSGPVIITEGDCDCRLYEKILEGGAWRFVPGGGWESVVEALDYLRRRGINCVVGVVDRDYRFALGILSEGADLLCTDKHDLEMMMYETEALSAIMRESGSAAKVSSWPGSVSGIRTHLFKQARPIGYVRLSNEAGRCGYSFEKLNYESFVERSTVILDVEKFIRYLQQRWPENVAVSRENHDKGRVLADEFSLNEDGVLCCGHDVSEMLSIGLRGLWGTNPTRGCRPEEIEKMLRLAYSREDFLKTELYKKLMEWCRRFKEKG